MALARSVSLGIEIACRKTDVISDADISDSRGLSDLADQSVLLVGPGRNSRIAQQPVKFQFRDLVALAGALYRHVALSSRLREISK